MAVSFLTPVRTVLIIGDDGLSIYSVNFNSSILRETVVWEAEDFTETVVNSITKDCGNKPVLILNDMTDQHFKGGQTLPKVGVMDQANVLKRRLEVAFPNFPIRGALPTKAKKTKEKGKDEEGGRRLKPGKSYLFAAVPMSEPVAKTINAVKESLAPIVGFYLLPIESADMVKKLSEEIAEDSKKPAKWSIFLGQHNSGTLRQVITRDGQLAMTRMTPLSKKDLSPADWAGEVLQEFRATISYLSRFGYSAEDTADIIAISSADAGQALENMIDIEANYISMTAPEAARQLGINIGIQENPTYADALHAAWIGRKNKFSLPMQAKEIAKVHQPRQVAALVMFLAILGLGYLGWQVYNDFDALSQVKDEISTEERKLANAEADYETEAVKMEALGLDVKLIQAAIRTFESFEEEKFDTLGLIKGIDQSLGEELRLDALTFDYIQPPELAANTFLSPEEEAARVARVEAAIKLSFPRTIEPEEGVREVNNLRRRLQNNLRGYEIEILKNVAGLEYSDTFEGAAGRSAEEISEEDYVAEILIKGAVK